MTTFDHKTVACAICGAKVDVTRLLSTRSRGWPDLDLRPVPPHRDALWSCVEVCTNCGYAASDVSKADKRVRAIMDSDEWLALTRQKEPSAVAGPDPDAELNQLLRRMATRRRGSARAFLCASFIAERLGQTYWAALDALYAAWVEDDARNSVEAATNRREAARLFAQALDGDQLGDATPTSVRLVLVDVLRRAAQWDEALARCDELENAPLNEIETACLRFERSMILRNDDRCYRVGDATAAAASTSADAHGSSPPAGLS